VESLAGRLLDGRYRLEEKLGEGGYGMVYRALQLDIERPVAVKILHPGKVVHAAGLGDAEDARAYWLSCLTRFHREARAAGRIRHPNVVAVTAFGSVGDELAYLVMEYLQGRSVRSLLRSNKVLDAESALRILRPTAWAMECAHREGIIHRDLKPSNIFLERAEGVGEIVKVLDFGIAKFTHDADADMPSLTGDGLLVGTPRYMSPEQCEGKPVDARSDIYSLGVVMYEMLTGTVPFSGSSISVATQHVTRAPRPVTDFSPHTPPKTAALVMRCLEKSPAARPQTAAELAIALEDAMSEAFARVASSPPRGSRIEISLASPNRTESGPSSPAASSDTARIPRAEAAPVGATSEDPTVVRSTPPKTPPAGFPSVAPIPTVVVPAATSVPPGMTYIPAGFFTMGCEVGLPDERPPHVVYVNAFLLDRTEVTNRQYRAFCDATGRKYPPDSPRDIGYFRDKPECPVVNVTWDDAAAYAAWAGKRLPTEAEWERAARGGLEGKLYPWGDDITTGHANFALSRTKRVASYFPNAYGLYDIVGNVWEWCADWYQPNYYGESPSENPRGPAQGMRRVLRGGSTEGQKTTLRVSYRHHLPPWSYGTDIGFRCAMDVPAADDRTPKTKRS
jgi:serine/threonine-protein kinase